MIAPEREYSRMIVSEHYFVMMAPEHYCSLVTPECVVVYARA